LAEILPKLFLGGEKDASNLELLKKHKISYVLNVTHDRPNTFAHLENFTYKNLPVEDNCKANLTDLFPEAFTFIGRFIMYTDTHEFNS
jgi:dual specificity MAP kinase phosphatase